jgi:ADP-L-glycero-D-manno-heptose 6-epimerase
MFLVTGGAGFIGSNLVAALEARGAEVAVCDRLGHGDKWRNLAKRELADLVPPDRLMDWLDGRKLDGVYHMGAISTTTETDADLILAQNFSTSLALWGWCTKAQVPLVYASSAATYGAGGAGFEDDERPGALAKLRPMNAYGWSKHLFDRRAVRLAASGAKPPRWAGLKFFNVYGPNEYHKGEQLSVAWQIHQRVKAGEPARLFKSYEAKYPDGGQLRDFVWVGDCVDVALWVGGNADGIFNVGTGEARSFDDLAKAVFRASNREPKIVYVDMPEAMRDRYQYFTRSSPEKLRRAGYARPFTSLEEGVKRYVQDYLIKSDPYL